MCVNVINVCGSIVFKFARRQETLYPREETESRFDPSRSRVGGIRAVLLIILNVGIEKSNILIC